MLPEPTEQGQGQQPTSDTTTGLTERSGLNPQPTGQQAQPDGQQQQPQGEQQGQDGQQVSATTSQAAKIEPTPVDNKALIRDAVAATFEALDRPQQQTHQVGPRQTPEQEEAAFRQKYGVVGVTVEDINLIINNEKPEVAAAHLNKLLQSVARQAVLMSQGLGEAAYAQLQTRFTPLEEHHKQVIEERLTKKFYELYPDLKGEEPLLEEIGAAFNGRILAKTMKKFDSDKEMFDAVAARAKTVLAKLRPAGTGTARSGQPVGQTSRQMTPTSMGGRTGGQPQQKPQNTAVRLFGADAR